MRNQVNFTISILEEITPKEQQFEVWDAKVQGLAIRVNPGGSKTFILCKNIEGVARRIKIGRFGQITIDNARKQALVLNGQIAVGIKPHQLVNQRKEELTFAELFNKYYNEHSLVHNKRPEDNKACVQFHLIPKIGKWKLSDITRTKMKQIHLEQGNTRGKIQANRVLNIASAVFNFGQREEVFKGVNPCNGIRRFKTKSRDRFLSSDEMPKFFDALKLEEQHFQDFFKLSLFIGARKTTMLQMRFDQIDLELRRWRLNEEQTKNSDVNTYTLSDLAVEILLRRKEENLNSPSPSPFVFPGTGNAGHLADPKKSWARIKKRMEVDDLRIHDLRRTLGSYMAINNASLPIIGKALNHKSQISTEIYARLSQDPVLSALNDAVNKITQVAA